MTPIYILQAHPGRAVQEDVDGLSLPETPRRGRSFDYGGGDCGSWVSVEK